MSKDALEYRSCHNKFSQIKLNKRKQKSHTQQAINRNMKINKIDMNIEYIPNTQIIQE